MAQLQTPGVHRSLLHRQNQPIVACRSVSPSGQPEKLSKYEEFAIIHYSPFSIDFIKHHYP